MDNFDLRKYLAEGRLFKEEYDPYDDYDNMDFSKLNPGQKAAFDEWLVQYSPDYFENKAEFQDMIDEFAEVENANDLADFVHDEFAGDKYERLVFIRQLEKAYLDDVEFDASATWTRADTTTIAFATGSLEANGKLEVLNFYNNFIYHSKQISAIQPYFGLGAGFSYSELNIEDIIGEVIGTQDRYTSVGVQFVLGADLLTFNNFSGGARVVGRRINNTEEQISSREVISGHFDLSYNF